MGWWSGAETGALIWALYTRTLTHRGPYRLGTIQLQHSLIHCRLLLLAAIQEQV